METSYQRVFEGYFDAPPKPQAKVVRVFLSSTFTDYSVERNALIQQVYPVIKQYCRERYGIDFQVVDMRWGIRQDAQDDHRQNDICLKEIEMAQRVSAGPNFILLMGQRYGTRSLNHHIPAEELDMFQAVWTQQQVDPQQLALIETWFRRDDNAVPSVYVLQRISSILKNYLNNEDQVAGEADREEWRRIESVISGMLKQAAMECFRQGRIDEERLKMYTVSVTEREIISGILKASDVPRRVLVFDRILDDIDLSHPKAGRFVDMIGKEVDEEAREAKDLLRKQVLSRVETSNVFQYRIPWDAKDGISEDQHADYLDQFCECFRHECLRLIDASVQTEMSGIDPVCSEINEHARHCYESVSRFRGREELVEKLRQYVTSDRREVPFVVYGESGSGKTSVMAKAVMETQGWLQDPSHTRVILRFLGTTPGSSSTFSTLRSVCAQMNKLYNLDSEMDIPNDADQLQLYFTELLLRVPSEHKLFIFLDSLDQLSNASTLSLHWIPRTLPPNIRLVLSVLPGNILDGLKVLFGGTWEENTLRVEPLTADTSMDILLAWFQQNGRQLTEEQKKELNDYVHQIECLPLHIKLIYDKVCNITSYEKLSSTDLPTAVRDIIVEVFQKLMNDHGEKLVSHALGYMTLNSSGVSETELEDVLSLDEEVLTDVYQFHLPSVRRLPSILWARIRQDIEDYIVEREADGVSVIYWYHRQFIEAAKENFLSLSGSRENSKVTVAFSQLLLDYYMGTWSGKLKPFEYSDYWMNKLQLDSNEGEADRLVPDQRIETVVVDEHGKKIIRYNRRKVSLLLVLIKHLNDHGNKNIYSFDTFLFNYQFLHAAFICIPWGTIFDISDRFEFGLIVMMCGSFVSDHPNDFAAQACGRMLLLKGLNEKVGAFIEECDQFCLEHSAFVSPHQQLPGLAGAEVFSFHKHNSPITALCVAKDRDTCGTISNRISVLNMSSMSTDMLPLPRVDESVQHFYLHVVKDILDMLAILVYPSALFVLATKANQMMFTYQVETNLIQGVLVVNTLIAIWREKQEHVDVYDFKEKRLVAQLSSPNSGSVHQLLVLPKCYVPSEDSISHFWVFWENGDITCHDVDNLSDPPIKEAVGVRVKSLFSGKVQDHAVAVLENGMLVRFSLIEDSIEHDIYCLQQPLPNDYHEMSCNYTGSTVLFRSKDKLHIIHQIESSYPVLHGSVQESCDLAILDGEIDRLYTARQGTVKMFKIVRMLDEQCLQIVGLLVCDPHVRNITSLLAFDAMLLTASEDGIFKMLQFATIISESVEFDRNEEHICKIAPRHSLAVTLDKGGVCATIWDMANGKIVNRVEMGDDVQVHDAMLSADESGLAVSTVNGAISVFRGTSDSPAQSEFTITCKTPCHLLFCTQLGSFVAVSPDLVLLISQEDSSTQEIKVNVIPEIAVVAGAMLVALAADRKELVVVSLVNKSVLRHIPLQQYSNAVTSISPAGESTIVLHSNSRHLVVADVESSKMTTLSEEAIFAATASNTVAFMTTKLVSICSVPSMETKQQVVLDSSHQYSHLCLTPDGDYVVYVQLPRLLHLHRVRDGALIGSYCIHGDILLLSISADSRFVLSATDDCRLFVLLIADPEVDEHRARIKALPSRDKEIVQAIEPKEFDAESCEEGSIHFESDEIDFIKNQECSELPEWARTTKFILKFQEPEAPAEMKNDGISSPPPTSRLQSQMGKAENDRTKYTAAEQTLLKVTQKSSACTLL